MTSKDVTNTTRSPLGLPNGQIIDPGKTSRVKNWEKIESNTVVKAWLSVEALTLADVDGEGDSAQSAPADTTSTTAAGTTQTNAPAGAPWAKPDDGANAEREKELRGMTNADLKSYIEARGGEVESNAVKDELVKQALSLPVDAK